MDAHTPRGVPEPDSGQSVKQFQHPKTKFGRGEELETDSIHVALSTTRCHGLVSKVAMNLELQTQCQQSGR